ncbi:NAD(P)H-binding protein [Spirosoma sp.]|uniref:NAD(P)H-binding protein n=1 Tax=Spirosoma sp. TaxID=1899569 RepID=UPI00261A06CD|nr:NAD(P)H-binding protein [Spirosoma sp.]MCX6215292.1 NAD(P)H-binding protein [Spirosoma sp.]
MKIIITGSLGNVGQPLATHLVEQGHGVTVISSQTDRQSAINELGATPAIGSLEDVNFLTTTFIGADAVFCMVPPNINVPDSRAYYQGIGRCYVQAVKESGVKRVVHLSSWGGHLSEGTGFIAGSHDVEQLFNTLMDVAITHLRAGSMYYNLYAFMDMIKQVGFMGTNYGDDDLVAMVAPVDIAAAAAEELGRSANGHDVRYVVSGEYTANEAARILGAAIGKPDLRWMTFTDEQTQHGLEQNGIPPHVATGLVELGASIHNGRLGEHYQQDKPRTMGKVKLAEFAQEFAAAYARA